MTDQITRPSTFEILVREVPERLLVTEARTVSQPELQGWLPAAMDRVYRQGAALGNPEGPGMTIYHGEVTPEKSSLVEATMVIPHETPAEARPANTRLDPAHREAYTRITRAQLRFPEILGAYEAVSKWIADNGHEVADSPREVYFADVMGAADDDLVCDIAFPFR